MYGSEKWIVERDRTRRWAYRLLGEVAVPGRLRAYHVLKAISRVSKRSDRLNVLDAGSGRGDLAIHLARRCPRWHIVGVEADAAKTEAARKIAKQLGLNNVEFRVGKLEDLACEGEFDLAVSADVLEHIDDDRAVLANLCRALRPGGHVIVTSPSVPQRPHLPTVRWREKRIGFHNSQYGHVRDGYSKEDLRRKFLEAGGNVTVCTYTFGFFGTLAFDIFFSIGDNRPNPLVFAAFFPFLMALAGLDLLFPSRSGSAVLAIAARAGKGLE